MAKIENWIKWDLDSRTGVKMSAFFADHGSAGYGFFLFIIELLYREESNRLDHDMVYAYAKVCKAMQTDAKLYIDDAILLGLLNSDGRLFWSPRVDREIAERKARESEISQKRSAASNARWNKTNGLDAKAMQSNASAMQKHANDAREEEIREEKIYKHTTYVANEIPKTPKPKTVRATTENKTEFAPGVFLTEAEHSGFITKFGSQFVTRCCEKLSAWIEQDPIPKRKRNGVNAAATFRAWVLNSVSEEESRASRTNNKTPVLNNALAVREHNFNFVRQMMERDDDNT